MEPPLRLSALREDLRESLWFFPTVAVVGALLAGFVLGRVEASAGAWLDVVLFSGDADVARGLLSTLFGAFVTVIGVVFTGTIVALQIASQQFSPRLLRTFLRDRGTQAALSVFLGTCAYLAAVLQALPATGPSGSRVGVTGALVLSLVSVATLVYFIHHITRSIRVEAIMLGVEGETAAAIRRIYPHPVPATPARAHPAPPADAVAILATRSGYLQAVDLDDLVAAATHDDAVVRLHPRVGGHVAAGGLLGWAWPARPGGVVADPLRVGDRVNGALQLGFDRDMVQDASFGVGQLVDMAVKALSPAVNDPRTAVEAVHHLEVLLCELGSRHLHWLVGRGPGGEVRVLVERPSFGDYLDLACDQVRRYGAGEPLVTVGLLEMLGDCAGAVDATRRDALERHVTLVLEAAELRTVQAADLEAVRVAAAEARRRIDLLCPRPPDPAPRGTAAPAAVD